MRRSTRERLLVLLSRWRVEAGWIAVLAVPLAHPTRASILAGLPVLGTGVAIRVWARGHLDRAERVTTGGPYAFVRHPLYVGSFFIAFAFAIMSRVPLLPIFVAAFFVLMYVPKALREEAFLRRRFGAAYAQYGSRVGAMVPSLRAARVEVTSDFAWRRVMRHREWRTWVGVAVALGLVCALAALRSVPDGPGVAASVADMPRRVAAEQSVR